MDDGAAILGLVNKRDVLADAVIGLRLEAPPVGPQRAADSVGAEHVGDLVGLDAVMEGRDLVAELLREIDDLRHLVGAIAVLLHQDFAVEHAHQRVEFEVAIGRGWRVLGVFLLVALHRYGRFGFLLPDVEVGFVLVPFAPVLARLLPGFAIAGDIAHAREWRAARELSAAIAVNALGVLPARHLQRVGRAGELHALRRARQHVLDDHAAPAEQVRGAGQDLHRRDAAGHGAGEARIVRPDRMLDPDLGRNRTRSLVAVLVRFDAGRGVSSKMGMDVDNARGHPFSGGVDRLDSGRHGHSGLGADGRNLAALDQYRAAFDHAAEAVEHRGVADEDVFGRHRLVGRRIGVLRVGHSRGHRLHRFAGCRRGAGCFRRCRGGGAGRGGKRDKWQKFPEMHSGPADFVGAMSAHAQRMRQTLHTQEARGCMGKRCDTNSQNLASLDENMSARARKCGSPQPYVRVNLRWS